MQDTATLASKLVLAQIREKLFITKNVITINGCMIWANELDVEISIDPGGTRAKLLPEQGEQVRELVNQFVNDLQKITMTA